MVGVLIVGYFIECLVFVIGGYYSWFKDFMKVKKYFNLGFFIVEVFVNGECVIIKEKSLNGVVNIEIVIF